MTVTRPTPEAVGGISLLERAVTYALGSLHQVTLDRLPYPTPCGAWNLRDLLAHLDDSLLALCEAGQTGQVPVDPPVGPLDRDPVRALRDRARQLLETWAAAVDRPLVTICGRPLSTGILAATGALEVVAHGWDIARTCGSARPVPPALAEELLDLAPLLVTDLDRPGRFAGPVDMPAAVAAGDRLVAFLGRYPDWSAPTGTTAWAA